MGHCHLFPGGFGESKRDEFGVPGTAEHLHAFVKSCGFDKAQVLAPVEDPADPSVNARIAGRDGLDWLLAQPHVGVSENSALLPAATIRPDAPGAAEKLKTAIALGVRMLKVHPVIMRSNTLAPESAPFWRAADAARMVVVYHTGGGGWGWTGECASPSACAALAGKYGGISLLMAHCGVFGGEDRFEEGVCAAEAHPNLYFDTTAALLPVGAARWNKALDRLGPGRVIYGNDYPWVTRDSVAEEVRFIDSLGLSPDEMEMVLGGNLLRLWGAARFAA